MKKKSRIDKYIKYLYYKKTGFNLPFYFKVYIRGIKYELCIYAMNLDWKSLRIKIMKDDVKILYVIKKGLY